MSEMFEMHVRVGGDPRGYEEFAALCDELAKLGHPACPDVDWCKVEQLCLVMFGKNGADLQTLGFYTLARSQRDDLEGMVQGLNLLEALSREWSVLWPPATSMRLDTLEWLLVQLQSLLRGFSVAAHQASTLVQLDRVVVRLHERLVNQTSLSLPTLLVLRQQINGLTQRLQRHQPASVAVLQPVGLAQSAWVLPVTRLPPAYIKVHKRPLVPWLCVGALTVVLATAGAWYTWLADPAVEVVPLPTQLDSLSLFDAGSAVLRAGSTDVLINALVDIKAQPGWLIVIAGHTDATGLDAHNLQLSQARASAVRDWMQRMGNIPADCFAVQGFAASRPIADNATEAGRMANRRVEIHLVPQRGACSYSTLEATAKPMPVS
ncbi:OmpA family protein [Pseudomonas sp. SMN5]|uniref:OmpA family protein n=1 Tax=Pseudomonas sp. SMN5 TaxID=3390198 RepID=UPI003F858D70